MIYFNRLLQCEIDRPYNNSDEIAEEYKMFYYLLGKLRL